jgi:hypothetical protein
MRIPVQLDALAHGAHLAHGGEQHQRAPVREANERADFVGEASVVGVCARRTGVGRGRRYRARARQVERALATIIEHIRQLERRVRLKPQLPREKVEPPVDQS